MKENLSTPTHLLEKYSNRVVRLFYDNLYIRWAISLFVLSLLYILVSTHDNLQTQFAIAYGSILFLYIIMHLKIESEALTVFVKILATIVVLRYLYWRTFDSLVYNGFFDYIGALLLYFAELVAIGIYLLGIFTSINILKRQPIDLIEYKEYEYPTVDVLIPTYNEPYEMVEKTVLAALAFDYPKSKFKVFICDDGGTDQKCNDKDPKKAQAARARRKHFQQFAKRSGAFYLTRAKNEHAKAGNMNSALQYINNDLLLILDADHIPAPQFLQKTVGWFNKDPKMFLVQTPHSFYNADPTERNLQMFGTSISENDYINVYNLSQMDSCLISFGIYSIDKVGNIEAFNGYKCGTYKFINKKPDKVTLLSPLNNQCITKNGKRGFPY